MPQRFVLFYDHLGVVRLNAMANRPAWKRFALVMAWAGSLEGCVFIWAILACLNHSLALPLITSGVLGLAILKAIKHTLRRPRPFVSHPQYVIAHGPVPDVFSLPSGHAMHAASLGMIVALTWSWAWPLAIAWYVAMAVSRPMLGLHFPSDVLLGGILGSALGWLCWMLFAS